ncbi:MAG: ADP-ribosylglycohydrolase family protein [Candidatus Enteromonas sp.]|nr:ADP-ribosylglycohydrolase family protein [Candidatus Enteromonas sp.]
MLGAIYGDIAGSPYEPGTSYWYEQRIPYDFTLFGPESHFTDDSLMTLAVANALVVSRSDMGDYRRNLIRSMLKIAHDYPNVGWGENFRRWLFDKGDYPSPINSFGNGAAMRISPVGWVCDTLEETIALSKITTEVSHNHPEGIKGAEAIAVAIFLARNGSIKEEIKEKMIGYYPEIKDMTIAGLISSFYGDPEWSGWITCQGSVPQAICAFLESDSLESAVRNAIRLNADADTQAAMAGAIAEAFYGFSYADEDRVLGYLPADLQSICHAFRIIKKKRQKR